MIRKLMLGTVATLGLMASAPAGRNVLADDGHLGPSVLLAQRPRPDVGITYVVWYKERTSDNWYVYVRTPNIQWAQHAVAMLHDIGVSAYYEINYN